MKTYNHSEHNKSSGHKTGMDVPLEQEKEKGNA
jgi:hypothetical protein